MRASLLPGYTDAPKRRRGQRPSRSCYFLLLFILGFTLYEVSIRTEKKLPQWLPFTTPEKIKAVHPEQGVALPHIDAPSSNTATGKEPPHSGKETVVPSVPAGPKPCDPHSSKVGDKVKCRFEQAKAQFEVLQSSQSKTVAEAEAKYLTRYGRSPPIGFAKWVQYALEKKARIIDNYDQLESDMKPFRKIDAAVLLDRVNAAQKRYDSPLFAMFNITQGAFNLSWQNNDNLRKGIHSFVDPFAAQLPDMQIIYSWDDRCQLRTPVPGSDTGVERRGWSGEDAWSYLTAMCPVNNIADTPINAARPSMSLCGPNAKAEMGNRHSLFNSCGASFINTVPLLSSAKLSTFQDILVPRVEYSFNGDRGWGAQADHIAFADKKDSFYWRGSSSGAVLTNMNWNNGHRPRFVLTLQEWTRLAQQLRANLVTPQQVLARPDFSSLNLKPDALDALSRLPASTFDVGFSSLVACDQAPSWCEKLASVSPLMGKAQITAMYEHKFVFDLDGNGMSGRFYRLLESHSVVFKQTVLAEWHDDRLIPWLHYIPVNLDFDELPQILEYFIHDAEGKRIAAEIAQRSREWAGAVLRPEDMSVYMYRVLLEYSSLFTHQQEVIRKDADLEIGVN